MRSPSFGSCPRHPSGRLTIIANPRGKAALATATGEPAPLAKALLSLGQSVVGFDPLFVGESLDPQQPGLATARDGSLRDLQPSRWPPIRCKTWRPSSPGPDSQPDVREVSLVGQDLAGPQVLLARPVLEGLARTAVDLGELPDPQAPTRTRLNSTFPACSVRRLQRGGRARRPLPRSGFTGALANSTSHRPRPRTRLSGADHVLRLEPRRPSADRDRGMDRCTVTDEGSTTLHAAPAICNARMSRSRGRTPTRKARRSR